MVIEPVLGGVKAPPRVPDACDFDEAVSPADDVLKVSGGSDGAAANVLVSLVKGFELRWMNPEIDPTSSACPTEVVILHSA